MADSNSWEDVREFSVPADACPSEGAAAVEFVLDERICSEFKECGERLSLSRLRGEVDCGDSFTVARSAEGASLIRVGAKLHKSADRAYAAVRRRPRERRTAVRIGVDSGAQFDEQRYRICPIGLGRPDERFVEHLLRMVGGPQAGNPPWGR